MACLSVVGMIHELTPGLQVLELQGCLAHLGLSVILGTELPLAQVPLYLLSYRLEA